VDLRHLATFRAIVEAGSFARAAGRTGIGASTVTLHVHRLEHELGGPLFVRQGRRLTLTELGATLSRHADAIGRHLDILGQEASELAAAARGTIHLGAIEPAAHLDVAPLVARLARGRPGITLRLEVGGTGLLAAGVAAGRLPFAVCSAPPPALDLAFEPLFHEPIGLLVPAGDALSRRPGPVPASALATRAVLVGEQGCAYRNTAVAAFADAGIPLDVRGEIADTPALVAAVLAGASAALVPLAGLRPAPTGTATRRVDGLDLALTVGIVRPRAGEPHSALTSQVLAAIRDAAPRWRL
jgi:DNA-binding transcriptional LysR family regulator